MITKLGLWRMKRKIRHVAEPGEQLVDFELATSRQLGVPAACVLLVGEEAFYAYNEPP